MKKLLLAFLLVVSPAFAQHRPQDMEIHERFYQTWMQPDRPDYSCCSKQDCQPAPSKYENGKWYARWEDWPKDVWVTIPENKIEQVRDNPDGRSHMCGRWRFGDGAVKVDPDNNFLVFCFIRGGGA